MEPGVHKRRFPAGGPEVLDGWKQGNEPLR